MSRIRIAWNFVRWLVSQRGNVLSYRVEHDMQGLPCFIVVAETVWVNHPGAAFIVVDGDVYVPVNRADPQHGYVWIGPATKATFDAMAKSFAPVSELDTRIAGVDATDDELIAAYDENVRTHMGW